MKSAQRIVGRVALGLVVVMVVGLGVVKLRFGRGAPYPDLNTAPRLAEADVELLGAFDFPLGNVTSAGPRIFFNTHPFTQSHRFTDAFLFELVDGQARPYPDRATQPELKFVFGMTVDAQNRLWLTAPATLDRQRTRLLAFDLASNQKVIDHELPAGVARFGQDLRVTADGKTLVLADTGAFRFTHAALVIVDVATWKTRELLARDVATQPQDLLMHHGGVPYRVGFGLLTFQVGVDGIAFSKDGEWLYFATMSHDTLYRVKTASLLDESLSDEALSGRLEKVGKKPLSDGIETAPDGSVLLTDVEHGSLVRIDAAGRLSTLVRLPSVIWSDGVNVTSQGDVLFTDSSIPSYIDPLLRPPTLAKLAARRPYHLYRFRLPH